MTLLRFPNYTENNVAVWQCDCGSQHFVLYIDTNIQCAECGVFAGANDEVRLLYPYHWKPPPKSA